MTKVAPLPLRFGVVDLETSGLSVDRHRILQLALVTVVDGVVVDRWSTYVRLRRFWQRLGPRHVHGIRRRDLRGAPTLHDALVELRDRLAGTTFVAHNAAFDAAFLAEAARREHVDLILGATVCTLRMSRRLDPERQRSHRLGDLCARYGVTNGRPHDALEDAAATAAVLPHLLLAHEVATSADLERFAVPTLLLTDPHRGAPLRWRHRATVGRIRQPLADR